MMVFGLLFTSHPNPQEEPYPQRDVHARATDEVIEACMACPAFRPPARRAAAAA